jgi:hypothetical protein
MKIPSLFKYNNETTLYFKVKQEMLEAEGGIATLSFYLKIKIKHPQCSFPFRV